MTYTIAQVAAKLQVARQTVNRWHKEGRLPPRLKVCRTVRFDREVIDAWIAAGCPPQESSQTETRTAEKELQPC